MDKTGFEYWLKESGFSSGTIQSRISNCMRVEQFEGDLDKHFQYDEMKSLIKRLQFSKSDQDSKRPVSHNVDIKGDEYTGTATLRQAINLYLRFKAGRTQEKRNVKVINDENSTYKNKVEINEKIDSYAKFLERFNIDKKSLYQFGVEETKLPEIDVIWKEWINLKKRVFNNEEVYIRGAGRDAKGTPIYLEFYKYLFSNSNVKKDPTNNMKPQQIIQSLTGYRRNANIFNYQVSHIFGMTKNPLLFEAPWNLALVPKLIDPLTGHETKGNWPVEYQHYFFEHIHKRYSEFIEDYNDIVLSLKLEEKLDEFLAYIDVTKFESVDQFKKNILKEFKMIG